MILFRLIDERQDRFPKDSDVYRRADITKSVFSAIRSKQDYQPTKNTAVSLAIALELSLYEALDLLGRAGRTNYVQICILCAKSTIQRTGDFS